jgi:hypothetical protein
LLAQVKPKQEQEKTDIFSVRRVSHGIFCRNVSHDSQREEKRKKNGEEKAQNLFHDSVLKTQNRENVKIFYRTPKFNP